MHADYQRTPGAGPRPPSRKHAEENPSAAWTPEAVLNRADWRERAASGRAPGAPPALEQRVDAPVSKRIGRAVAVPAAAGAVAFVIAVAIAIVLTMLQLRPAAEAAGQITREVAAAGGEAGTDPGTEPGSGESVDAQENPADAAPVLVHVVGEVQHPGVVELPAGSRVAEAIEAVGGARASAVLSAVNLARLVADGEQILVPDAEQAAAGAAAVPPVSGAAGGAAAPGGGLLDLNSADAASLETLPRVGPALAQRILDWREANGGFASVEQLLEVSGIGAKTLDGFRELVTVR